MQKTKSKKDYYAIHSRAVNDYLLGVRSNPLICTNRTIAKKLQREYNVKLEKREKVNEQYGLYMFEIVKEWLKRRLLY